MGVVSPGYCWFNGQGWRWWWVGMRDNAGGGMGLPHVGRSWSPSRVQCEDTDDTRSHRLPGKQLWVGCSWKLSVFTERH